MTDSAPRGAARQLIKACATRARAALCLPAKDPERVANLHRAAVNSTMLALLAWSVFKSGSLFTTTPVLLAVTAFLRASEALRADTAIAWVMSECTFASRDLVHYMLENKTFALAAALGTRVALFGGDTPSAQLTLALLLLTAPRFRDVARRAYESAFKSAAMASYTTIREPLSVEAFMVVTYFVLLLASLLVDGWGTAPQAAFVHATTLAFYAQHLADDLDFFETLDRVAVVVLGARRPLFRFFSRNELFGLAILALVQGPAPTLARIAFPLLAPAALHVTALYAERARREFRAREDDSDDSDDSEDSDGDGDVDPPVVHKKSE